MRHLFLILSTTCLGAASCAGFGSEPDGPYTPVLGTWDMVSELGDTTIEATMTLELEHDALAGVWSSQDREMALDGIAFDGGTLSFVRAMGDMQLGFTATVDGDHMQGQHSGDLGEIPCTGQRRTDGSGEVQRVPRPGDSDDRLAYLDSLEADFDARSERALPRDAFNVLDDPVLVPASEATSLEPDEHVVGVVAGGEARAYPIGALAESELLNGTCGDVPIAVSW